MRTEEEMMKLILDFAAKDDSIRVVGMEGSRTNPNVPKDIFRDYDISYIVTECEKFIDNEDWLQIFGKQLMMQKPEAMSWFPAHGQWFSFLMSFDDGNKIDLKIIPLEDLDAYLNSDKLLQILLDKDGAVKNPPMPTDKDYWIAEPNADYFDDVCNEFWHVASYVAKGLCRKEHIYAAYHMEQIIRPQLLTMISWSIGSRHGFGFSLGKQYKFLDQYLTPSQWNALMETYRLDSIEHIWNALFSSFNQFGDYSKDVADTYGYRYPDYDKNMSEYIRGLSDKYYK